MPPNASAPPPPLTEDPRSRWLQEQWQAYHRMPEEGPAQLGPALEVYEQVLAAPQASGFGVELSLFLCELLMHERRFEQVDRLVEQALSWTEQGLAPQARAALLSLQCRMHWLFQRHGEALQALALLNELTQHSQDPLLWAHQRRAFAQALFAQREYRRAIELYREAIALHRELGQPGSWLGMFSLIAACHRALGERDAMLAAFAENASEGVAQRRWCAASNAYTGIAEEYAERGELQMAEQALTRARDCAHRAPAVPAWLEKELWAVEAVCSALQGDHAQAVARMRQVIASSHNSSARDKSRRLRQLVPWLTALGQGQEALATLEQAHGLELDEAHEAGRKELASRLRDVELEYARAEQARNAQHAAVLAARNQALERALALQHELQTELIEASKLATLGNLLAGMSHELNTPLGITLTAVSTVADLSHHLGQQLRQGAISRKEFEHGLGQCAGGSELARRNLERALELISTYQQLNATPKHELWLEAQLDELIRSTWSRSIDPRSALRLEVDADLRVSVHQEAFSEVLRQLFQNVERHAYADGETGQVRVQAQIHEDQVALSVSDQGRGIDPELLPRIFDPYVSTQFGQGRSGLGLFVARAAAVQGLEGRLRAHSKPGEGSCFELSWPLVREAASAPQ